MFGSDLLGDDQLGKCPDVAGFGIDGAAQFTGRADRFFSGGQQRFFDGLHKDLLVNAFLAFPVFQYGQKLCVHRHKIRSLVENKKVGRIFISDFGALANQQYST